MLVQMLAEKNTNYLWKSSTRSRVQYKR